MSILGIVVTFFCIISNYGYKIKYPSRTTMYWLLNINVFAQICLHAYIGVMLYNVGMFSIRLI